MKTKISTNYIINITCVILILVPTIFTLLTYNGFSFLIYLIFYTFIPGYVIVSILKPIKIPSSIKFVLAFLVGISILFIEYFVLYFLNQMNLIIYINPIISVTALILNYKKIKIDFTLIKSVINKNSSFIIFLTFCVYITLFTLNFNMPSALDITYADYTWQIGNINQLSSKIPFDDIRVTGVQFTYHFFNTLYFGIAKIITGMQGWVYLIQYQVFFMPALLAISIYSLIKKAIKNEIFVFILSIATYIGFSFSYHYTNLSFEISSNANAVGLATVVVIVLFFIVSSLFENIAVSNKGVFINILYGLVLIVLLTGTKGPYTIVFLVALLCAFIIKSINNKRINKSVTVFLSIALPVFLVLYMILFVSGTSGYFTEDFFNTFLRSAVRTSAFTEAYKILGENLIARVILLIPSLIFTFTFAIVPLLFSSIKLLKCVFLKYDMAYDKVFAVFIFLVGTTAYYTFFIVGTSQVYFILTALPFVGYIVAYEINSFIIKKQNYKKILIIALSLMTIISFNKSIITSLTDYSFNAVSVFFTQDDTHYSNVKLEEHEAYAFLNEYIKDDRLILTNRLTPNGFKDAVFHEISAFSEKKCYFEGYLYAQRNLNFQDEAVRVQEVIDMFSNEWTQKEKYDFQNLKNIGYIVVFLNQKDIDDITLPSASEYYIEIFKNDSVVIFELN